MLKEREAGKLVFHNASNRKIKVFTKEMFYISTHITFYCLKNYF